MLILVTELKDRRVALRQALAERGIYSLACPFETAEFHCREKDTGGVLFDCVGYLARAEILCERIRKLYPEMPIAALLFPTDVPNMEVQRLIRVTEESPLEEVFDFCIRNCGWSIGPLGTRVLHMENAPSKTIYMGYPLSLSPCEHRLLRCLLYRAPRITGMDDLIALCYPGEHVSLATLQKRISNINRRARDLDPRPLIVNVYGQGYRLRDGILM